MQLLIGSYINLISKLAAKTQHSPLFVSQSLAAMARALLLWAEKWHFLGHSLPARTSREVFARARL